MGRMEERIVLILNFIGSLLRICAYGFSLSLITVLLDSYLGDILSRWIPRLVATLMIIYGVGISLLIEIPEALTKEKAIQLIKDKQVRRFYFYFSIMLALVIGHIFLRIQARLQEPLYSIYTKWGFALTLMIITNIILYIVLFTYDRRGEVKLLFKRMLN